MNAAIEVDRGRLLALREQKGLSQTRLAALIREHGGTTTASYISRLESGKRRYLSVTQYAAFVLALKVPHSYLRADTAENTNAERIPA